MMMDHNIINEGWGKMTYVKAGDEIKAEQVNQLDARISAQADKNTSMVNRINEVGLMFNEPQLNFIAHRGYNAVAPENSLPAFRLVTRHWGFECDIQVTSDGEWIVMHDDTVDRTTDGTGKVKEKTFEEIKELKLNAGNRVDKYTDADLQIPTIHDVLLIGKKTGVTPVIEIKSGSYSDENYDNLAKIIAGYGMTNKILMISFKQPILLEMKKRLPTLATSFLVSAVTDTAIASAKELLPYAGLNVGYTDVNLTFETVEKVHNEGLQIGVWAPPESRRADFEKIGLDYITTDSLSGNLRYAELEPEGEFENYVSPIHVNPFVKEIAPGVIELYAVVKGGANTQNTTIFKLPEWATPMSARWAMCTARTATGADICTFDINPFGKVARPNEVLVGLNWEGRTSWASLHAVYGIS